MFRNLTTFRITLIYLLVAVVWIAVTDLALGNLISDPILLSQFQTYKGLFYVIVTSVGLYLLVRTREEQIQGKKEELAHLTGEYDTDLELMEKLFDSIPILLTFYDPRLKEFQVNREFEQVTGWTNQEIADIDLLKACYPDPDLRKEVTRFMERPGSGWKDFELTIKTGEVIPTSWNNIILSDQTQVGIGIDLTDLKESELQATKSQLLLDKVFESLEESVILVDPESRTITNCNRATERLFGYSKEEMIGSSTRILHVNEEQFREFNLFGKKALEEHGVFHTEFLMKTKEGEVFHSDHTVTLVENRKGEVDRVVSAIRDITEKKKHRAALEKSEKRYRNMFEVNPDPSFVYDPETLKIVEVNDAAVTRYGYSREEFMELALTDLVPRKIAGKTKKATEYRIGKTYSNFEWENIKKDGTILNVLVSGTDLHYGEKTYRLIVIKDITEQKNVQDRIIESTIEGIDRERERIAHDLHDGLGQYMVAASMNLESVKSDIEPLPERRKKQFITGLELLKQALSETHTIAYNLMPRVLEDYGLLLAVENLIEDYTQSTDIRFNFSCTENDIDLDKKIEINIYRIVQELISNAVRHSGCSTIHVSIEEADGLLAFRIEDDGKGIAAGDLQENQDGLGFHSIETRVRTLHGTFNIESSEAAGTVVTVSVPLEKNSRKTGRENG